MKLSPKWIFFASFTAIFTLLVAFVFWGTWSPDFAPVMPDNPIWHAIPQSGQLAAWFRGWLGSGSFAPTDLVWSDGFVSGYWTQEFKYAIALYLSGLALAWFLRGRGLSRLASYGAGLFLGFCGYWSTLFSAGHGGWFIWMSYGVFAFGLVDRALAGGSWRTWFLLGAVVAWGSFNQPDLWLLFTLFTGIYFLYRAIVIRRAAGAPAWSAWGKGVAVAAVALFAIGLPSFRGALTGALAGRDRQIEESKGTALAGGRGAVGENATAEEKAKADAEARWVFVTNWSMPPEDTLEFFIPRIHGDTCCPMTIQLGRAAGRDVKPYTGRLGRPLNAPRGCYRQHSLYVGWVTCLLALLGIVWAGAKVARRGTGDGNGDSGRETKDVVFFVVAALVFWLFSMGRFCEPAYRLAYLLPFGDYLRGPVKWHHLTELCLCVLAGYGLDALHGWLRSRGCGARIAFALVAAFAVFGATDLARNDRLFCGPIDLRVVTGRNAAADEIVRRGKGTLCDLVEGAQGLLGWSFGARGVGVTRDMAAKDVRFVFAGAEQVKRNPRLAAWLKAKATPVGSYVLTREGIRSADPLSANVSLHQVNGVPPPPPPEYPPVRGGTLALGLLSFAGFLVVLLIAGRKLWQMKQGRTS